jgi:hypothetical protein
LASGSSSWNLPRSYCRISATPTTGLVMEKICTTVSRANGLLFSRSARPKAPKYTSRPRSYTSAEAPMIRLSSTMRPSAASMMAGSTVGGSAAASGGATAGAGAGGGAWPNAGATSKQTAANTALLKFIAPLLVYGCATVMIR